MSLDRPNKPARSTPTKVPGIPAPPVGTPRDLKAYLEQLSEAVQIRLGRRGDPIDRAVTFRDLRDGGVINYTVVNSGDDGSIIEPNPNPGNGSGIPPVDAPDTPTGFSANGAYTSINLNWDLVQYLGHAYTEIYRYPSDDLGAALAAGVYAQESGTVFIDAVGTGQTFYYWIRFVNERGVIGDWYSLAGVEATTALDVPYLLDILEDQLSESQFVDLLKGDHALLGAVETATTDSYVIKVNGTDVYGQPIASGMAIVLDQNGNPGTSTSGIVFAANTFAVGSPASGGTPPLTRVPFQVITTPTVIDGVTVPAGVYMKSAFIYDAQITSAKIKTVNADTITSGEINANRIGADTITAEKIDFGTTAQITANPQGSIVVKDLTLTSLKLAGNAVSVPFSFRRFYQPTTNASGQTVPGCWANIPVSGAPTNFRRGFSFTIPAAFYCPGNLSNRPIGRVLVAVTMSLSGDTGSDGGNSGNLMNIFTTDGTNSGAGSSVSVPVIWNISGDRLIWSCPVSFNHTSELSNNQRNTTGIDCVVYADNIAGSNAYSAQNLGDVDITVTCLQR